MLLHRFVAWVRLWALRVAPHAVLRRVIRTPPAYPTHVPVVLHRQHAVHGHDARDTAWSNALRAAHAVREVYPHDAHVASYAQRVTTAYAALFR